jgi:hypothetical protein
LSREELLKQYPLKRIKPTDGMAVTAEVWEEAHQHHRQSQGFHAVFSHGPGIVAGLEVIANDPPDTSVYILSGMAIDPAGQTIVLPEPVTYDIGREMDGQLYLLLSYGESRPKADNREAQSGAPLRIHTEFSISAVTTPPKTPWVELARVQRSSRNGTFVNASNRASPGPDEIDLRFRREVGAPPEVKMAVCYAGQAANKHSRGASYLAQAINHWGRFRLFVEDGVPLGPNIASKTMVYLVGQGAFELDQTLQNGLRNYVHRGMGTLFLEAADSAAETSFTNLLQATGMQPEPLKPGHRLLTYPNLFAAPPLGFGSQNTSKIMVAEGVIFDTCNYGLLWQGERHNGMPSREEIRTAVEWGENIIAYALERHRMSGKR